MLVSEEGENCLSECLGAVKAVCLQSLTVQLVLCDETG